tara:strand:- start:25 stop:252 length:228 start_codon:yes stop_codon:yes gene_type:complete
VHAAALVLHVANEFSATTTSVPHVNRRDLASVTWFAAVLDPFHIFVPLLLLKVADLQSWLSVQRDGVFKHVLAMV